MYNFGVIISFVLGFVIMFIITKLIFKNSHLFLGIIANIVVSVFILWILDVVGLGIAINWITAGIVGLLGVPGVVILIILKYFIK